MNLSLTFLSLYSIISIIAVFIGLWKIFEKAGKTSWHSIIPIYNIYAWLKILEKPFWWFILFLVPFLGFFIFLLMIWETIRCFGKKSYKHLLLGTIFGYIYIPWLGFDKNEKFTKLSDLPKVKKTKVQEWVDAILFAVVAAYIIRAFLIEFYVIPTSSMESTLMVGDYLAVSKISYGPKLPQTPIAFPFAHHTLPLTKFVKSYVEWIKFPYYRFFGFEKVENNDVVVFNYPDGDTVALEMQNMSYYQLVREYEQMMKMENVSDYYKGSGWKYVQDNYKVTARPVDKRENYIKRCVAIPGDKLQVINGQLFINDKPANNPEKMQYQYIVYTNGTEVGKKTRQKININEEDIIKGESFIKNNPEVSTNYKSILAYVDSLKSNPFNFIFALTNGALDKFKQLANVVKIERLMVPDTIWDERVFPQNINYKWNRDNYGPITMPKAGVTVKLDTTTLPLYRRIIEIYEGNNLKVEGATILINGKPANNYTFKMGYYWMMGDNRHNSADSRYWGFVPEDHIVGKAVFVWLSLDKYKGWFDGKIRWSRMFRGVK